MGYLSRWLSVERKIRLRCVGVADLEKKVSKSKLEAKQARGESKDGQMGRVKPLARKRNSFQQRSKDTSSRCSGVLTATPLTTKSTNVVSVDNSIQSHPTSLSKGTEMLSHCLGPICKSHD